MLARQKNSEARAAGIVVRAQGRRRFAPSDCIQVQNPLVLFWCRRRDSNSQALRRTILSRVRLPISTLRQFNTYHSISISSKNQIPILLV